MKRRHRNPSPSPVLVVGGIAAVAALAYLALRKTTVATTRAIVDGAVSQGTSPAMLSYSGDNHGRALTPAEVAALRYVDPSGL